MADATGSQNVEKYILFKLCDNTYGVPLMSTREVVERGPVQKIPNSKPYFTGVMDIRGEMIGVINLRTHFYGVADESPNPAVILFNVENGGYGVMVDTLITVEEFSFDKIDYDPKVASKVPLKFLMGITKYNDEIVSLVNLKLLIEDENQDRKTSLDKVG